MTDLGAYGFELTYDPGVVTFVSVTNGTFLGSTGRTITCAGPVVTAASVAFGCDSTGSQPGPVGTGTLATVVFGAVAEGTSDLTLSNVLVDDVGGVAIPVTVDDGQITIIAPASTPAATAAVTVTHTPPVCAASDTGFHSPGLEAAAPGGSGDGFEVNPQGAFEDGAGFATDSDGSGDRHLYEHPTLAFAGNCTVNGIEVRLDWWLDDTAGTNSLSIELSWDGGTSWTAPKSDSGESLAERTIILGSPTDTWGRTWTRSEFASGLFLVRVTANSDTLPHVFNLDWIPVKIYDGA